MKKLFISLLTITITLSFIGCNKASDDNNSATDIIRLPETDKIEASEDVQLWAQDEIDRLVHMLTVDGFFKDENRSGELIAIGVQESKITNLQLVKRLDFNDKETIDLYLFDFKLLPTNITDQSLFQLDNKGWITSDDNFTFSDANGYEVKKGQLYLLIHNNNGTVAGMGVRRAEPLTEKWCEDLLAYYNPDSDAD